MTMRYDIQGLRAIAVLAVLVFHINSAWLPGGFTGVDIFFVISGFLISSILIRLREQRGQGGLGRFYLGRIKRIVPAYLVMLIVVTIACLFLLVPDEFRLFRRSLIQGLFFNSAHYFGNVNDYFAPDSHELPVLHTWTLAIEMQFYLLLPLVLYVLPIRLSKIAIPVIAVGLLVWSQWALGTPENAQKIYFSLPARVPEFLLGTALALYGVGTRWAGRYTALSGIAGLGLIVTGFIVIDGSTPFPGLWAMLPCLGAALIIVSKDGPVARFLTLRTMVWIGALSYSIYLWHWPVLAIARYLTMEYTLPVLLVACLIPVIFGFSYLSWRLIENPCRCVATKPFLLALVITVGVFGAFTSESKEFNRSISAVLTPAKSYPETVAVGEIDCKDSPCRIGDLTASNPMILVLGDSHAEHLKGFFAEIGGRHHLQFTLAHMSGCHAIPGISLEHVKPNFRENCSLALERIKPMLDSAQVVVLASRWYNYPTFFDDLDNFLGDMEGIGKPVVVISQVHEYKRSPIRIDRFQDMGLIDPGVRIEERPEPESANAIMKSVVERHPGVTYLDLWNSPLFQNGPIYDGRVTYLDKHHLNEYASRIYGRLASDQVASLIKKMLGQTDSR